MKYGRKALIYKKEQRCSQIVKSTDFGELCPGAQNSFEWKDFHSSAKCSWYKLQLIGRRDEGLNGEFHYPPLPLLPRPQSRPVSSSRCHWVWWVRQWSGDSDPQNLPLPAPWLLDIVPTPGSAPEEGVHSWRGLGNSSLRFKLQLAHWSRGLVRAHQSPAPDPGPQRAHCQHLPRHCWPSTALCRRLIPRFLSVGSLLILFLGLKIPNGPRLLKLQLSNLVSDSIQINYL